MAPRLAFWVDQHVGATIEINIMAARRSAGGVTLNEAEISGAKLKKNVEELSRGEAERWLKCCGCRN